MEIIIFRFWGTVHVDLVAIRNLIDAQQLNKIQGRPNAYHNGNTTQKHHKGFAFCKIVTKSNRNPISVILAVTSDLCRKIEGYTKYDLIGWRMYRTLFLTNHRNLYIRLTQLDVLPGVSHYRRKTLFFSLNFQFCSWTVVFFHSWRRQLY